MLQLLTPKHTVNCSPESAASRTLGTLVPEKVQFVGKNGTQAVLPFIQVFLKKKENTELDAFNPCLLYQGYRGW